MPALPQHKTDMIFRVANLDRYDDRDVVITNLLESYDRMSEFAKKHLNNPFVLEGMQSVSRRLKDTIIENKDFEALIKQYDRENAFIYCDPPYYLTEGHYEVIFRKVDHYRLRGATSFLHTQGTLRRAYFCPTKML